MDSSSISSRFRFRDHQEVESQMQSDTSSGVSSVSSDESDDEYEPISMTGKGIKHLCSELLELKTASDEDFHQTISSNYSRFIRVFEEVEGMENELSQLKNHVLTHNRLIKNLIDGIYLEALSEKAPISIIEESVVSELSPPDKLKIRCDDVSETLDILLSENRIDEALAILEMEDDCFQRMQDEENIPEDALEFYNSAIYERKDMIKLQLKMVAENPRTPAPEVQKAVAGLCRLGDSHLATQLLLKYYCSRIAAGIQNLQCSKSFLHQVYIRELAKFVFSMISQAARSFVMLYGETSPYASEFIQWAREATKVFVACFNKYINSISEISGGLLTAVEAVRFAVSFCSQLETLNIALCPYLMKHLRPCMEEVLQIHIDHFKKVVNILTAMDTWALGQYLVSGILNEGFCSIIVGQQPEYCLLTNSGRKLVTLLQAIAEDIYPLVSLRMEDSICRGFIDLFKEYVYILERAITCKRNIEEQSSSRVIMAETLQQKVSVLANLSTLEYLSSIIIRSIFNGNTFNYEQMDNPEVGYQQELENFVLFVQEASGQFRANFFQQFIDTTLSLETSSRITSENFINSQSDSDNLHNGVPSAIFQVLFLELRKVEKLAEENVFDVEWLMELLRELIEAIFIWIPNNREIWAADEDNTVADNFDQMALDMQFLAEIANYGGYFSNDPSILVTLIKSAFYSSGIYLNRDVNNGEWAVNATEAIQKLLELKKIKLPPNVETDDDIIQEPYESHSDYACDASQDARSSSHNSIESDESPMPLDSLEISANMETEINEASPHEDTLDLLKGGSSDDGTAINLINTSVILEDTESNIRADAANELQIIEETDIPVTMLSIHVVQDTSNISICIEESARGQLDAEDSLTNKPEDDPDTLLKAEVPCAEGVAALQCQGERNNACVASFQHKPEEIQG